MSWLAHHTLSEEYANKAEEHSKRQEAAQAIDLYRLAAEAELKALEAIESGKNRTLGITALSAASLYYKAQDFAQAKKIAYKWLASDLLPPFSVEALEDLLQVILQDRACVESRA